MLFNSVPFIFGFLPAVLAIYWVLRGRSVPGANAFLVLASFLFYGWWNQANIPILAGSVAFNFAVGFIICRYPRHAKLALVIGVVGDLAALSYFKYLQFFAQNLAALTGLEIEAPPIELPLGISFFTFTQIAYLVDAYRGKVQDQNPVNYTLFVSYFPHLIAGPILHHKQMLPQFADRSPRNLDLSLVLGFAIFVVGLVKKVVLADPIGVYASEAFAQVDQGVILSSVEAWVGALAYTMQLYFDFSAYCDMAVGLSFMLGVRLPINFFSPYKATSIIDFWRRWHITLSYFLRDYLYIPLGGNRYGQLRRYANIAITMWLGGLWHGASWTFVIWGGLHALYLIVNHLFRSLGGRLSALPAWALTFFVVVVAWVFFRAETLSGATNMIGSMFGWHAPLLSETATRNWLGGATLHLALLMVIVLGCPNIYQMTVKYRPAIMPPYLEAMAEASPPRLLSWRPGLVSGIVYGVAFSVCIFILTRRDIPSEFLYFQF